MDKAEGAQNGLYEKVGEVGRLVNQRQEPAPPQWLATPTAPATPSPWEGSTPMDNTPTAAPSWWDTATVGSDPAAQAGGR